MAGRIVLQVSAESIPRQAGGSFTSNTSPTILPLLMKTVPHTHPPMPLPMQTVPYIKSFHLIRRTGEDRQRAGRKIGKIFNPLSFLTRRENQFKHPHAGLLLVTG